MIKMGHIVADDEGRLMYVIARTTQGKIVCTWRSINTIETGEFYEADVSLVQSIEDAKALPVPEVPGEPSVSVSGEERWYLDESLSDTPTAVKVRIDACEISMGDPRGGFRRKIGVPYRLLALTERGAFERMEHEIAEELSRDEERIHRDRQRWSDVVQEKLRRWGKVE